MEEIDKKINKTLESGTYVWYIIRTNIRIGVIAMIEQCISQTVQIIYNDRNRNISIRIIQVLSVRNGKVRAFCTSANGPHVFNTDNIIDVELVKQHA